MKSSNVWKIQLQRAIAILLGIVGTLIGSALPLRAQGVPDVVWMTNGHSGTVRSLAIATNGFFLVSGSEDRTAKAWTLTNGTLVRTFATPSEWVFSVAISPLGDLIGTGGDEGKTRVWRMIDGVQLWSGGPDTVVRSLAFRPDGVRIASGRANGTISIRTSLGPTGDGQVFYFDDDAFSVAYSPDGTLLAASTGNYSSSEYGYGLVRLFRPADESVVRDFNGHAKAVFAVDFSPDGTLLATASKDGTARLWRVNDGTQLRVLEGGGGNTIKFTADGQVLVTVLHRELYGTEAGTIKFWRVSDGRLLHTYLNTGVLCLDVARDGKHFAYGHEDGTVVLARMPVLITEFTRASGQTILRWQGGTGHYQLQQCTNFGSGNWENIGSSTTATTATNPPAGNQVFYRVQSLPK
jgi:WD40 repeat protein